MTFAHALELSNRLVLGILAGAAFHCLMGVAAAAYAFAEQCRKPRKVTLEWNPTFTVHHQYPADDPPEPWQGR